eukprot:15456930-Alexandrium_andersonii.AAC.1
MHFGRAARRHQRYDLSLVVLRGVWLLPWQVCREVWVGSGRQARVSWLRRRRGARKGVETMADRTFYSVAAASAVQAFP